MVVNMEVNNHIVCITSSQTLLQCKHETRAKATHHSSCSIGVKTIDQILKLAIKRKPDRMILNTTRRNNYT